VFDAFWAKLTASLTQCYTDFDRDKSRLVFPLKENDSVQISVDRAEIAEFCRVHNIRRLSIFGSVLREDFGPNSDVDVLVEFEP